MMKRWIVILPAVFLLVTGCARFRGNRPEPSVISIVPTSASAPDFASMTFVEENNLYLELLAERQTESADTSAAEEAYALFLDATLEGNSAQTDQYLQQAILLLWNK